ncbi:MAG: hypothetical protein QMC80_00675 [Thermoplasmatales archaeon]|nr:hypothetical protein [Thermoplasmatales archaeon]
MKKCKECDGEMKEIDFSSIPEIKHTKIAGKAYECKKCGDIELDMETSRKLRKKLISDKSVKIDRTIWEKINTFIRKHRTEYPSMKFFTQKAVTEKLRRESKA